MGKLHCTGAGKAILTQISTMNVLDFLQRDTFCYIPLAEWFLIYFVALETTESKIHFTTACNKLMTSQSSDWVESNTVNPNFAFMPTGEHTEQKIICDHILNQFSH